MHGLSDENYTKIIIPQWDIIEIMVRSGHTNKIICKRIGISLSTYWRLIRERPDFKKLVARPEAVLGSRPSLSKRIKIAEKICDHYRNNRRSLSVSCKRAGTNRMTFLRWVKRYKEIRELYDDVSKHLCHNSKSLSNRIIDGEIFPIWEHIDPKRLIKLIDEKTQWRHSEREDIIDWLYDFYYAQDPSSSWAKKLVNCRSENEKYQFIWATMRYVVNSYFSRSMAKRNSKNQLYINMENTYVCDNCSVVY